jgi:hypothetical protein
MVTWHGKYHLPSYVTRKTHLDPIPFGTAARTPMTHSGGLKEPTNPSVAAAAAAGKVRTDSSSRD